MAKARRPLSLWQKTWRWLVGGGFALVVAGVWAKVSTEDMTKAFAYMVSLVYQEDVRPAVVEEAQRKGRDLALPNCDFVSITMNYLDVGSAALKSANLDELEQRFKMVFTDVDQAVKSQVDTLDGGNVPSADESRTKVELLQRANTKLSQAIGGAARMFRNSAATKSDLENEVQYATALSLFAFDDLSVLGVGPDALSCQGKGPKELSAKLAQSLPKVVAQQNEDQTKRIEELKEQGKPAQAKAAEKLSKPPTEQTLSRIVREMKLGLF